MLDVENIDEIARFRQFRVNLVGFLRLPSDIRETALRQAVQGCSPNLLTSYLERMERVLNAKMWATRRQ